MASDESRKLILMRHAKSDWADESLSDHDRPLNKRGKRDAPRMASWLASVDCQPDRILCSSSARTCETAALMSEAWMTDPDIQYCKSLYLASPESILAAIRAEAGDAQSVLVLAHNPGMSHIVSVLSNKFRDMPTAAAAVFDVDSDWVNLLSKQECRLVDFMRPKALEDA